MKKLFENVDGNQFRLITESTGKTNNELLREGLRKIFAAANPEISYKTLQNIGWGYVKEVGQATKRALQEAREIAPEFGYSDDVKSKKFIKLNEEHSETDMSNPEEAREVQIGKKILEISQNYGLRTSKHELPEEVSKSGFDAITKLATELLTMHGGK